MSQAEKWAAQELAKHTTRESMAKRLATEISFQEMCADLPRPASISERKWEESAKGHTLLIERLQIALAA
jgi:hypothetical protein